MGNTDKMIRVIIALLLVGFYFMGIITGTIGMVLLILSAVFILTSLVSFCPLYTLLGINTCPAKKKSL